MKKSNNFTLLCFVVLVLIVIYLLCQYIEARKVRNRLIAIIENYSDKLPVMEACMNNRLHELTLNGTYISESDIISDVEGAEYKLLDILEGNTLIMRFSPLNCRICIEKQLEILQFYKDSIPFNNIICLADFENNLQMKRFLKINNINYRTFHINSGLAEKIVDLGLPYFFIIDRNSLRINKVLVPLKEESNLTHKYIRSVIQKYFE